MPYSDPEVAKQRARERMRANRTGEHQGEQTTRENRENVLPQAQTGEQGERENNRENMPRENRENRTFNYVVGDKFRAMSVADLRRAVPFLVTIDGEVIGVTRIDVEGAIDIV